MTYPEENFDLASELKKQTRIIQEDTVETFEESKTPEFDASDFDFSKISENSESSKIDEKEQEPTPEPVSLDQLRKEAAATIEFLGNLGSLLLPVMYRKELFSKEEYDRAKVLIDKYSGKSDSDETLSEPDKIIYRKMLDYKIQVDSIPFSDEEIRLCSEPLAEIMQKYKKRASPELRLLFAFGTVMVPRFFPFFMKS